VNQPEPPEVAEGHRADPGRAGAGFAHASEAEFARILDFYQVEWRYEPHVFPILWSIDGDVLESFAPDFYLPEFDIYVEMTTLRQKLVRKKNRKLRRLRELYPDINIKLFYARDFRALMLKYGRVALADALTGAVGQFTPANPGPAVVADPVGGTTRVEVRSGVPAAGPAPTGPVPADPSPTEPAHSEAASVDRVRSAGAASPAGTAKAHTARRRRPRARRAVTAGLADAHRGLIDVDAASDAARAMPDEGAAR
jgi:hypothetical protein